MASGGLDLAAEFRHGRFEIADKARPAGISERGRRTRPTAAALDDAED
jgi:hypothetical protein